MEKNNKSEKIEKAMCSLQEKKVDQRRGQEKLKNK